jgi:hypothetical protein
MNKASGIAGMVAAVFLAVSSTSHAARAQVQPPPPQVTNTYAAKFICGVQQESAINFVADAQAGRYSTKINIHNNTGQLIRFRKKVIQLRGGQVPTEPQAKLDPESLRPDWAKEVVCLDIYKHLNIALSPQAPPPYIEGFVILEVLHLFHAPAPPPDPLDVEGIYTYRGDLPPLGTPPNPGAGVSIAVVVYPAKSNKHPMQ